MQKSFLVTNKFVGIEFSSMKIVYLIICDTLFKCVFFFNKKGWYMSIELK